MRYHNITKDDMLNGCGLRVVLWVSGCTHHCKDCHNPITWDLCGGLPFDADAKEELFEALAKDYISGLTLSGGDPLHPANRKEIGELICEVKSRFPQKNIWLYTGFCFEEIRELPFLSMIDVIVDGRFVRELKDLTLHWRGSKNQRIIDVKRTLRVDNYVEGSNYNANLDYIKDSSYNANLDYVKDSSYNANLDYTNDSSCMACSDDIVLFEEDLKDETYCTISESESRAVYKRLVGF